MRAVWIGAWCLLACAVVRADPTAAVVKVLSGRCSEALTFRGSGMLIAFRGATYVLTSDHVVLHSPNEMYCHEIWAPQWGEHRAEFLAAEWGNGLALLRVPDLSAAALPRLEELQQGLPEKGEGVALMGFPSDSETVVQDPNGVVFDPQAEHLFFALVPRLVEVHQAHGEFGMSGGPVFSSSGKFRGVLSHQILQAGQNDLFAIPATVVHPWVAGILADPGNARVFFCEDPYVQHTKESQVDSADLSYTWKWRGFTDEHWMVNIVAFGCLRAMAYHDPLGRLQRVADFLVSPEGKNRNAEMIYFRRGEKPSLEPLIAVSGLVDFFHKLTDPTLEPIFTSFSSIFHGKVEETLPWSQEILERVEYYAENLPPQAPLPEVEKNWWRDLKTAATLLHGVSEKDPYADRWMMVTLRDVQALLQDTPAWDSFRAREATGAQILRADLQHIAINLSFVSFP